MRWVTGLVLGLSVVVTFCTKPALAESGGEEDSVVVFRNVNPSVVSLKNAEASGTGILIDSSGLILTNAHVVISPMPFTVAADVPDGAGSSKSFTFPKVEIVGYHPTLDLALVKVDGKLCGGKLKPAILARKKAEPGQHVFVIGNPAGGGQILTKSITAGMLSAVDREVEGGKFYQLDAAINPGNSGGPLCDRTGKVLGVITFKFTDAQAVGFATPTHDLDMKIFGPLNKRVPNVERAKQFFDAGQKLSQMARQAGGGTQMVRVRIPGPPGAPPRYQLMPQRRASDPNEAKFYSLYSAMCYHQALLYDSANSVTWYNLAIDFLNLKENEAGSAYMLRHIQLNPWGSPDGNAYREIGLALARMQHDEDAVAVYEEGVAKFPYNGRIWYDLALSQQKLHHSADAAYSSAIAQSVGVKGIVPGAVTKISAESRQALTSAEQSALDSKIFLAAIQAKLTAMLNSSNSARQAHTVYLTPGFIKYALANDGPVPPGVKEAIAMVVQPAGQVSGVSPAGPAVVGAPATQPAAVPGVGAPSPAATPAKPIVASGAPLAPLDAKAKNIVSEMTQLGRPEPASANGVVLHRGRLMTRDSVKVPFRLDVDAMTDSTNIRIGYSRGNVIFNWEMNKSELRCQNPATGHIDGLPGQGTIPVNQFVHITWIITADSSRVFVDGKERANIPGDYQSCFGKISVYPTGSTITIKSVVLSEVGK